MTQALRAWLLPCCHAGTKYILPPEAFTLLSLDHFTITTRLLIIHMREPLPPIALLQARENVVKTLSASEAAQKAAQKIREWHFQIQMWQDNDELATAFSEGRLTHRTMSHPGGKYDYGSRSDNNLLGIINNDNFYKPIVNEAKKLDSGGWAKSPTHAEREKTARLDAGGAGIMRRLTPDNFTTGPGMERSNKQLLGLHDLSASLLNPDGYTLKKYSELTLVVLTPLPLPEDVALFYQLRELSKSASCPSLAFKQAVEQMACQFTRPRIASSLDMGAQYVVTKSKRHGQDSIKYVKGSGAKVTSKETPAQCVQNVRTNYRDILKKDLTGANEITIAYRKYGTGNKFPCFAISIPGKTDYCDEVEIKLRESGQYADYEKTGFLISQKNFVRDRDPAVWVPGEANPPYDRLLQGTVEYRDQSEQEFRRQLQEVAVKAASKISQNDLRVFIFGPRNDPKTNVIKWTQMAIRTLNASGYKFQISRGFFDAGKIQVRFYDHLRSGVNF